MHLGTESDHQVLNGGHFFPLLCEYYYCFQYLRKGDKTKRENNLIRLPSSIESVLYGIKWGHSLAGIVDCPTSHPLVKSSLEGARRKLARPVQPKEPLSVDTVCGIADHYISSSSLAVIRFLFILLVGFAGSYTTLREEFRKYVKPFVNDIAKYGTHSIKSGAASNPACKNISADLLDMHAGWKCATSKHRYIKRSVNDRLKVSRSIALLFAIIYIISSLGGGLKSCLARPRFPIRFFPQGF